MRRWLVGFITALLSMPCASMELRRGSKSPSESPVDSDDPGCYPGQLPAEPMKVTWPTQHGLIVDAGSSGSRMHVYEWNSRRFNTVPPPFSFPLTSNRWTDRLAPGISSYADKPELVLESLVPLIDFAKEVLQGKEHQFKYYPIYLKATGGMRQLQTHQREAIIDHVRKALSNKTFCPFYFEHDYARVISGEEEGIYGWAAINFLLGNLFSEASQGAGTVDANRSVGAIDIGGASSQIAFFVPNQDILANMFKLQIGAQKHWNVYVHSFLYFGVNSARDRLTESLLDTHTLGKETLGNPCYPSGYQEEYKMPSGDKYVVQGIAPNTIDGCIDVTTPLLHLDMNAWCNFAHNKQCSFAGVYQPDLPPPGNFGNFYGFGQLVDIWAYLELEEQDTVENFHLAIQELCSMNWLELKDWNEKKPKGTRESSSPLLAHYCFYATYSYVLLTKGFHMEANRNLTVVDKINNLKVGWALGAMLYEINSLPWEYVKESTWLRAFISSLLLNFLLFIGVVFFIRKSHVSAKALITRRRSRKSLGSATDLPSEAFQVGSMNNGTRSGFTPIPETSALLEGTEGRPLNASRYT